MPPIFFTVDEFSKEEFINKYNKYIHQSSTGANFIKGSEGIHFINNNNISHNGEILSFSQMAELLDKQS